MVPVEETGVSAVLATFTSQSIASVGNGWLLQLVLPPPDPHARARSLSLSPPSPATFSFPSRGIVCVRGGVFIGVSLCLIDRPFRVRLTVAAPRLLGGFCLPSLPRVYVCEHVGLSVWRCVCVCVPVCACVCACVCESILLHTSRVVGVPAECAAPLHWWHRFFLHLYFLFRFLCLDLN